MSQITELHATAIKRIIYAYGLAFAPHAIKLFLLGGAGYQWDNTIGRHNMLRDNSVMRIDEASYKRARRADAAHQNGNESFPLFVAAVLAAVVAGVPGATVDKLTKNYLRLRLLYTLIFIVGGGQGIALTRTIVWGASAYQSLSLLSKSASALALKKL